MTTSSRPKVYFQALQHPFPMVDYYNVVPGHLSSNSIALNFLLFWRRRYNDVLRSTLHRYNVASPPALRNLCSNLSALNQPHPGSSYYQRHCNMMFYLYNKGKTRNLQRYGIILAEFGSTRRFVDLLRWTH